MRLTDWVFRFTQEYRYESCKLKAEEKECFEPFVEENLLSKPCQVEVMRFSRPFRVVGLFFLDKTKPDLLIHIQNGKWENLPASISKLQRKYNSIQVSHNDLSNLLERCRHYSGKSLFAIDFSKDVCVICFMHDPRFKRSPFPWELSYINNPQEMAEMILHLNIDQSSCYFDKHKL